MMNANGSLFFMTVVLPCKIFYLRELQFFIYLFQEGICEGNAIFMLNLQFSSSRYCIDHHLIQVGIDRMAECVFHKPTL